MAHKEERYEVVEKVAEGESLNDNSDWAKTRSCLRQLMESVERLRRQVIVLENMQNNFLLDLRRKRRKRRKRKS